MSLKHISALGNNASKREKEKAARERTREPRDMDLRSELLKSIWYAFTALDVEESGKVSKSQLKVSVGSSHWWHGDGEGLEVRC